MAGINLDKLNYRQLLDLEHKVNNAISAKKRAEKEALKRKMAALAAEAGFGIDEVMGSKRGPRKTSTVAPKYRHPRDASLTWTGRGRQPLWLVAEIKKGKTVDSFLIQ